MTGHDRKSGAGVPASPDGGSERTARRPRRLRLDLALVERGLEQSRERARRLIVAGEVTVNGQAVRAPSTLVPAEADLAIGKALPYVGRGGFKLAHALDRFGITPAGRTCLDAGASTGGFTDVLLQRGAARVYAVDVGKGLLAWTLRRDPRVVVMEGVNVRYVALPEPVSLAVADLAFISLRLALPALTKTLTADGEMIALVKPQFEAGQADVGKGGVVRDPRVHRRVLEDILEAVRTHGLFPAGITASPIRGQGGNVEFLLWAPRRPPATIAGNEAIEQALAEAGGAQAFE